MSIAPDSRLTAVGARVLPLALWGVILMCGGLLVFTVASVINLPIRVLFPAADPFFRDVVWLSGAPLTLGTLLVLADFLLF